jgi:paraquat-inducible protein B
VTPQFRAAQRWNIVWVVPVLAVLIGGWLIWQNVSSSGPVARVRFETADGISAGKTEVRCRSVRVGYVKDVELADDMKSVLVYLQMDPEARHLLRKGTRFWVVRPRVSTTDISGLGTLITGAYIELEPGSGPEGPTKFKGRETPPATSRSIPGLRLVLLADEAGSLSPGSPIYYRGYEVGRVESRRLDIEGRRVRYDAFIREEYAPLVKENTRFWNTSGIDVTADAEGFKLRTPSFQAMFSGGASFSVPEDMEPGIPVADGTEFTLFANESEAKRSSFTPTMRFLLLFDQSVRGLAKGAPVEFRGIPIGRVSDISFDYVPDSDDQRIPVLVEIDPTLLRAETAARMSDVDSAFLSQAVGKGLRAALKTGSFLTGSLFVDFDYYEDAPHEDVAIIGLYTTIPTVSSGLAQLEAKLSAVLDKIQALPLDTAMERITTTADEASKMMEDARAALKEIEGAAASMRATMDDPAFKGLAGDLGNTLDELRKSVASVGPDGAVQGDLLRTLDELRAALRSMKSLTTTIDEKPNSLLFGRESSGNPTPRAPRGQR